jgi:NAD(P)-dependent dehydrogenase (short-subunit alcohol dehydrogenase family)
MTMSLSDQVVVVIGIARAVTELVRSEAARVVVAGRDRAKLAAVYDDPGVRAETVDVTADRSIQQLVERVGPVNHVVSTVSARARGVLADLERSDLLRSFDTKVIGPTMLAKYFAPGMDPAGSFVLFSGSTPSPPA